MVKKRKEKKEKSWFKKHPILSIFLGIFIIGIIGGIFSEEPSQNNNIQSFTNSTNSNDKNINLNNCPIQGTFQSDKSYFIELYMLNRTDSPLNKDSAERLYNLGYYYGGNDVILKKIKIGLCSKCGIC